MANSNITTETAREIGSALIAAERSSSLALRDAGLLLAAMTAANLEAEIAMEADHECMERMVETIGTLVSTRGGYVRLHRRQKALAKRYCPDVLAEGDCPPRPAFLSVPSERKPTLAVVNA